MSFAPQLLSETDPVRHPTMTLELVEKKGRAHVRMLAPGEEAALRSKKRGDADQEASETYLTVVKEVHGDLRIRCDCLGETGERPIIVVRKLSKLRSDLYSLANMPDATVRHAEGCVFGPVDGNTRSRLAPPFGVLFDPFGPSYNRTGDIDPDPEPDRLRSFTGLSAGRETLKLRTSLRMLLTAAGLNTHAKVEGFASPREWLERVETAAQQFYIVEGITVSELLFTDPGCWSSGEVAERLDHMETKWPKSRKPTAFLCWVAHDVQDHEINRHSREAGYVWTDSEVVCPEIGLNRVSGPWIFFGAVSRSGESKPWSCLMACAQPIVSLECPVPVDSHQERRAWGELQHTVMALRDDVELQASLGGPVRVDLEKPLFQYRVEGGRCLPDFLVTVIRPGEPDDLHLGVRYTASHEVRYIIEVMGFDSPEYEDRKKATHSRMRGIGHVFRLEAQQFKSRYFSLENQCEKIIRRIRTDLLSRWGPDDGGI